MLRGGSSWGRCVGVLGKQTRNLMKTSTLLFGIACVLLPILGHATVWRVNNQGYGATFTGTNALLTAISHPDVDDNDTLHVEASPLTYGVITLARPLVLIGPGYFLSENSPQQANQRTANLSQLTIDFGADGAVISGLEIGNNKLAVRASDITIERCLIRNTVDLNYLNQNSSITNIVIRQNHFVGQNARVAHTVNSDSVTNLQIVNNSFDHQNSGGGNSVNLRSTTSGVVAQNVLHRTPVVYSGVSFYNNIIRAGIAMQQNDNSASNVHHNIFEATAFPTWLTGSMNYPANIVDVFVTSASPDGQWETAPGCTDCANGFNGETIGMYGGVDPYRLSGLPAIPSIYHLQTTGPVLEGGTLDVSIGTRSNNYGPWYATSQPLCLPAYWAWRTLRISYAGSIGSIRTLALGMLFRWIQHSSQHQTSLQRGSTSRSRERKSVSIWSVIARRMQTTVGV